MKKDKLAIGGWVLSVLIFLFLVFASASGKFTEWEGKAEMFQKFGYSVETMFKIGIVEVIVAALFLAPGRLGVIGVILLTGYLGGATEVHVRVGDPFYFPVVLGIVAWAAITLRDKNLRELVFKK